MLFNLPVKKEATVIAMIDIKAFLNPNMTTADDTIIKSVTNKDIPRLILDCCSKYRARMCMPPNDAPEFNTKLTPIPIRLPATIAAAIGEISGSVR